MLSDFTGRIFQLISVLSVCEVDIFSRLWEYNVLKSKFQILIPLIDFITTKKLSFSSKLPRFAFLKRFMGFVHHFEWMTIKLSNIQLLIIFLSRINSWC